MRRVGASGEQSVFVGGQIEVSKATKIADYGCKLMSKIQVRRAALKHKLLVHQV